MIGQGLPISRLVSVTIQTTPTPTLAPSINALVVVGTSAVIDTLSRMRAYPNLTAVAADFAPTMEEYQAAAAWFGQNPSPTNLYIGRWVNTPSHGALYGATLPIANQLISAWTGISNGAFNVTIDGGAPQHITGINFTAVTNLNGVASAINAAGLAGATMVWNANFKRFQLTSATTGTTSSVSFLTPPGTGTDISGMLAMLATSSGAFATPGLASETALAAIILLDNQYSTVFYGIVVPSASDADDEAIGAYVEGTNHYYGTTTNEAGALVPTDTTNVGYQLAQLGFRHTAWQYSSTSNFAIVSYLARILTTNWNGSNTVIDLMYKDEPGIVPELLNTTQANTIQANNGNVLATYVTGARVLQYGNSASGDPTDLIIGADALGRAIQNNYFNLLKGTPTKIPQTDPGQALLVGSIEAACVAFVTNGFAAPGIWNSSGFGTLNQGDFVAKGFYVFMPPIALQSEADRAARIASLAQVAVKTAGAVRTGDVLVVVNP